MPGMADSDSDSDGDRLGEILFDNLDPNALNIRAVSLDDMFAGVASKRRFFRGPNQENMRFLWQSGMHLTFSHIL